MQRMQMSKDLITSLRDDTFHELLHHLGSVKRKENQLNIFRLFFGPWCSSNTSIHLVEIHDTWMVREKDKYNVSGNMGILGLSGSEMALHCVYFLFY